MGFTLLAGFLLKIILVGGEGLDDTLHDEIVQSLLVSAEIGRMKSGRDYAMTVIGRFTIVKRVAGAEPSDFLGHMTVLGVVLQHAEVSAHGII